ncbi:MAG: ABC transporter ATP-binding protein, partial [Candidatus Ornithomonoglobus sp.]
MEMVELQGKEKQYPDNLSGGQQQRVALARSIVQQPKVLLLDEPLSAIDAKLRKSLQNSIKEIHRELGLTSVFVTHDQDEAMVMSDVIHLFHNGKIEQSSDPITMYTSPVSKFAAGFIGNYNLFSESEFTRLTGKTVETSDGVAVRPETFHIIEDGDADEGDYTFEGTVVDNTPKGNILQYHVKAKDIMLKIDVLFKDNVILENGRKIKVSVADKDCIRL